MSDNVDQGKKERKDRQAYGAVVALGRLRVIFLVRTDGQEHERRDAENPDDLCAKR